MKLWFPLCVFMCVSVLHGESFELLKKLKNIIRPATTSTTTATPVLLPDYEKEGEHVEGTTTTSNWVEDGEHQRSSTTTQKTGEGSYVEEELGLVTSTTTSSYGDDNGKQYEPTNLGGHPSVSSNLGYDNNQQPASQDVSTTPTIGDYDQPATRPTSTDPADNQFQRPSSGQAASPVAQSHPGNHYNHVKPTVPAYTGTATPTTNGIGYNQIQNNQQNKFRPQGNPHQTNQQSPNRPYENSDDGPIVFPSSVPYSHHASHHEGGTQNVFPSTSPRPVQDSNSNPELESYNNIGDARSLHTVKPSSEGNLNQYQGRPGYNDLGDTKRNVDQSATTEEYSDSRSPSQEPNKNEEGYDTSAPSTKGTPKNIPVPEEGRRVILTTAKKNCGPNQRADDHGNCRSYARK